LKNGAFDVHQTQALVDIHCPVIRIANFSDRMTCAGFQ
jgi:hypothetical protein